MSSRYKINASHQTSPKNAHQTTDRRRQQALEFVRSLNESIRQVGMCDGEVVAEFSQGDVVKITTKLVSTFHLRSKDERREAAQGIQREPSKQADDAKSFLDVQVNDLMRDTVSKHTVNRQNLAFDYGRITVVVENGSVNAILPAPRIRVKDEIERLAIELFHST